VGGVPVDIRQGFLAAVVDARDALVKQQLPAAPAAVVAVDPAVPLPPFMYSFVTKNAAMQFAAPLKPVMRALDKVREMRDRCLNLHCKRHSAIKGFCLNDRRPSFHFATRTSISR